MNRAVLSCIVFSVLLIGVPQGGQATRSILDVKATVVDGDRLPREAGMGTGYPR
jgi:hypothetical protein